jgi:hypothetical protein
MAMADFGIAGALILPLMVVASVGGFRGLFDRRNLPFVVFTLWWGLFSHNILGEFFFMIAISFMAASAADRGMHVPADTAERSAEGYDSIRGQRSPA